LLDPGLLDDLGCTLILVFVLLLVAIGNGNATAARRSALEFAEKLVLDCSSSLDPNNAAVAPFLRTEKGTTESLAVGFAVGLTAGLQ
jgi:hypothetical protein